MIGFADHFTATDIAAKRLAHKFWRNRLQDMIRHVCIDAALAAKHNSTAMPTHKVKIDRVSSDWPASGSVFVTRDDGKKFRLFHSRNKNSFDIMEV